MADGKITGRLIRQNVQQHKNNTSSTVYLTLVKPRGNYRDKSGTAQRGESDFLTFEYFMDGSTGAQNRANLLASLAQDTTLVEIDYNLKSRTYMDGDKKVFMEYKQLINFEILESKEAVKDRLSHQNGTTIAPVEQEEPQESTDSFEFNPNEAAAFIEESVSEHLADTSPKSTDDGKYGNPFKK